MNTLRIGDKMRQWRNGAGNAPRHYAGTRSATGCALSRTRSLTAAAIAVAMMATVAVTSLLPTYNAKADESSLADGSKCTPTSYTLGDASGMASEDTGVATYVGRDLYIGKNTNGKANISNENDVDGSYAVEAEGLTVVNGKLVMKPLKDSWKAPNSSGIYSSAGFRWGTVGFGSQFRPSDRKTVLAVGGANSGINSLSSGNVQGNVGAYGKGGFVGQSYTAWDSKNSYKPVASSAQGYQYKASIAGSETKWSNNTSRSSIVAAQGDWQKNNDVTFNAADPLKDVNGTDYTNYTEANLKTKLSAPLSKLEDTGTVNASGEASEGTATRYKYNYDKTTDPVSFQFTYNGGSTTVDGQSVKNNEKLITFTGDGKSATQVFSLTSEQLSSAGYRGVDFKFVNIPKDASIVINVSGDNIDFHTGWRFWWDKTDIGGGFSKAETDEVRKLYSSVAQKIMWNFKDAKNVTIRGGVANESNSEIDGNYQSKNTTDDPAAAMLGSILVPNGSFESHVSTNGRVYVGQDFMMYNPTAIAYENDKAGWEGKTASVLNMDQERHNLPWNGSYSTSCAAIAWNKVDDTAGHNALGGTSWTVYGKKEDAVHGTNALATIADGGWNDDADAEGSFQLGNLAKNGTYFLKESGTAEGYAQNTNIYQINTGSSTTEAAANISNVFDSAGGAISTDADKLLTDGKIINKKTGSAIEWQKVDGTDNSTLLAGSTWTLSKMNGNTTEQSWNITDDQSGTEVKSVKIFDENSNEVVSASFTNSTAQRFHAVAYDQNGTPIDNAKLTWSSADSAVAAVSENGLVTPTGNGNTTITVESADGKVTASFTVEVSGVTVETSVLINGYTDDQEISLEKGKTLKLTASVAPEDNTVTWSTSNADNVSLSANTGTSVTLTANKVTSSPVTITAKETRTSKSVTLKVNVTKPQATTTTVFFKMQGDFNQNNGQKLFLEWKTANGSWPSDTGDQPNRKEMTVASGCNGYVSYTINEVMPTSASFRIRRDKANWTTPQSFYRPDANSGFAFNGGDIVTLNTATEILGTAPSGCAVISTAAYSSRRVTSRSGEHRAVSAVLRAQGSVLNAVNETVSTKVDEDTAAGKFKVSDLANGTYQLQETKAPNGYDLSNTVYTITITSGKVTWNPDVTDSKIANTRKTGSVTWTKVSSDTNNSDPLSGSEWTLKQTKTFSWADGAAKYTVVTSEATLGMVTDCVDGQNGVAKCSAQTGEYVDLDGASGKFKISGLVWGEYQLIESKAPDGYDLDATPHTFRIGPLEDDNIAGNWYANTHFNTEGTSAYNEQTTFTVNGGNIKNQPGVILPGTGGAGDYWIYAAALVAALIGVVAAGMALKVRRRQ